MHYFYSPDISQPFVTLSNEESEHCVRVMRHREGDVVRVTEGLYKGATGIVKRIRKDRKLLVAISGVAVVAISHIPMCYLEKV